MRKVFTIALHEYWINVRRPDFIIFTSLVPLLGIVALIVSLFFGRQAGGAIVRMFDSGSDVTAVVDRSGEFTPILPRFEEEYVHYGDEAEARTALESGELQRVVVVPDTYRQEGEVTVVTEGSRFSGSGTSGLRAFFTAHLVEEIGDETLQARLIDPYDAQVEYIGEQAQASGGVAGEILSFIVPFLFGILLAVTIFVSSGYLVRSVAEEKSSRVIEIVLSSVTPQQLLAGKVVGLGALGLTQILVWIASAAGLSGGLVVLAGIMLPLLMRVEVFGLALVFYILGFGVYAVLIAAIGTLGSSFQESQQITGIFIFIAAIPMMLTGVIMTNPDAMVVRVLSWFPLTAPTTMMLRLPLADVPWFDVAGSIILLLITIPVVVWLGAKVFRLGMLMYGKRPGILEIVRLLKHA
ncbi:MAG: ABC transporter permease [Caldilineaceae bacterium]|nr:ABC transporter permease [Caldilineaceae bacterium]MDE0313192.1 ABC transporter permease [Caldilineaceae bacterium]